MPALLIHGKHFEQQGAKPSQKLLVRKKKEKGKRIKPRAVFFEVQAIDNGLILYSFGTLYP